ncbi:MAG: hypothetical protein ACXW25_13085, partial [Rhodospirillales bacterium]
MTLNARVLQTELMVAALACGEQQRYNAFVNTFKSELTQRGRLLRAYFKRVHGPSGENRMNAFVTKLANDASQRTANGPDAYCTASAKLFNEVLASSPRDLSRIAARPEISGRHGHARCRAGSSRSRPDRSAEPPSGSLSRAPKAQGGEGRAEGETSSGAAADAAAHVEIRAEVLAGVALGHGCDL